MVYNWLSKKSTRLTVACGKKIDLIVEDNQTKQGETTTIVCKFISQDHVSAIIGEVASSKSVEAAPICQASKIPQIATGLFYRRLSSGGHRPVCPRKITAQECRVYDGCEAGLQRRIGGKALEGAFFSNHFSVEDKSPLCSVVQAFVQKYKQKYNAIPDVLAGLGYDAAKRLADAITRAGSTDSEKLRAAIQATENFPGVAGKITGTPRSPRSSSRSKTARTSTPKPLEPKS
jgi:ABC-type branched-subunit amino acid transport system substrate-binding protein